MVAKTCFVIMAIGNQKLANGEEVKKADLKDKYDNLIKEAIQKADKDIEVVRADEISAPGTMSTDIITRIMHSDYVIADITYPNPNVFYELGLRHACRPGTIIIKEKGSPSVPFDISHLRHIEYENTTNGLKELSLELHKTFTVLSSKKGMPDNHFLEIAKLTNYQYPEYAKDKSEKQRNDIEFKKELMRSLFSDAESLRFFIEYNQGNKSQTDLMTFIAEKPEMLNLFMDNLEFFIKN